MVRFIVVLTGICVVAALVLGITYNTTKPLIAAQKEKEIKLALERVLPGAEEYRKKSFDAKEYYEGYKNGQLIGYIIPAEGDGYSGKIEMLVGVDKDSKITGVEVLSHDETPGLGAKCMEIKHGEKEPWFLRQFKGRAASELDLEHIEAITGATITTEAIIDGVKEAVKLFLERIKVKG